MRCKHVMYSVTHFWCEFYSFLSTSPSHSLYRWSYKDFHSISFYLSLSVCLHLSFPSSLHLVGHKARVLSGEWSACGWGGVARKGHRGLEHTGRFIKRRCPATITCTHQCHTTPSVYGAGCGASLTCPVHHTTAKEGSRLREGREGKRRMLLVSCAPS